MMDIIKLVKRNIVNLVYSICTIIFLVQICWITSDFIWPDTFNTVSYKEELNAHDFPAVIRVCVIPGFDEKQLFEAGYEDLHYFDGRSRLNSSIYGWTGHYKDRKNNLSAEGGLISFYECHLF